MDHNDCVYIFNGYHAVFMPYDDIHHVRLRTGILITLKLSYIKIPYSKSFISLTVAPYYILLLFKVTYSIELGTWGLRSYGICRWVSGSRPFEDTVSSIHR
jgi:hypothetical protein